MELVGINDNEIVEVHPFAPWQWVTCNYGDGYMPQLGQSPHTWCPQCVDPKLYEELP